MKILGKLLDVIVPNNFIQRILQYNGDCIKFVFNIFFSENEITKQDNCLYRHPHENLRAYLLTTLAAALNGSGQRLIHQFCDLYEHARHDPTPFGDEEYQQYNRLLLKLIDA